jgi:ABC-2 type transport system permease protein
VTGNLVFVLITPLSYFELFCAYVGAAIVRGVVVGAGVFLVAVLYVELPVYNPWVIVTFAVLASGVQGALGVIAGIWAEKFDQLAAFQNFIIMPLSFLSGVFYSIRSLPEVWQALSKFNPFFYMIDGFRYGFFGQSDVPVVTNLVLSATAFAVLSGWALALLNRGYKLRQ